MKKAVREKSLFSVGVWMLILNTAYSLLAGLLLMSPLYEILLNIFFQFFLMTVPGLAVTALFFGEKRDPLLTGVMSYAWGYVIIIAEYLMAMPLGRWLSLPVSLLVFLLSCAVLWKKRTEILTPYPDQKIPKGIVIVFFAVLIVSFFCFSAKNGGAFHASASFMITDNATWFNNASSLSVSLLPGNPRLSGYPLRYYYFSCIPLAFQGNALGMRIYSLGTVFYALPKTLLLTGGIYAVLSSLKLNKKSIVFGMVAIAFSTGIELITVQTYVSHMMEMPFGFDVGIGCACWMLYYIIEQYRRPAFRAELCAGCVIFMAAATGTKAPAAMIFIVAAGIICFGWLFGREYKKAFSFGLGLLAAFITVMMVFVYEDPSDSVRMGGFAPTQLLWYSYLTSFIYNNFIINIFPSFLAYPTMVLLQLLADPLMFFFGMTGILRIVKWKKARNSIYLGFAVSIVFGMFMGLFWAHAGTSNMYYSMTARVLSVLFGVCLYDKEFSQLKPLPARSIAGILSVILFFEMYIFFFIGYGDGCFLDMCKGAKRIITVHSQGVSENTADTGKISRAAIEALDWIRGNTDKDSIIATSASVTKEQGNNKDAYMYSSIFTERIIYMEGFHYVQEPKMLKEVHRRLDLLYDMYHNDTDALRQIKSEGVDYIVCNVDDFPEFQPDGQLVERVFSNGCTDVYRIR